MEGKEQEYSVNWLYYLKITGGVLLGWSFWFCLLIVVLRWVNPPFTSFTLQENWHEMGKERYNLRQSWVSVDDLPDHLKLAVIASEDQRFREHWGIDLAAIDQALEDNRKSDRLRGASTITQQVAKNLFLSSSKTYLRKGMEAVIAVLIDFFWTKDRILEVYLNTSEFGPAMYGIARGVDYYYDKHPSELTAEESARMATVLPSPWIIEAEPASEYVQNRSNWILRNMEQLSGIRYLPKPEPNPDTANTLEYESILLDSIDLAAIQDSIGLYLDSILMEMKLDSVNN